MQGVYRSACKPEVLYKCFGNWDFTLFIKSIHYVTVLFKFDEYKIKFK